MGEDNNLSDFQGDDLPVDNVSRQDAKKFCTALDQKEKRRQERPRYRLPYEAEWEHAARAGTTTPFWQGETITTSDANFDGKYPYIEGAGKGKYRATTTPVKMFRPNPFGLYDMGGNLFQWCEDYYDCYQQGELTDPKGPEKGRRVLRGCSWSSTAKYCRVAHRFATSPSHRNALFALRVVLPAATDG
jgi:formylglycine-generating enzyme required for sulfatase activity